MKTWQAQLGFFGSIIWLASFETTRWMLDHGYKSVSVGIDGYIMGVITALAGYAFYGRILQGRWNEFFGGGPIDRFISGSSLLIVLALGFMGFFSINFRSNPIEYIIPFLIGCFVTNQGIVPIINEFDK